MSDFKFKRITVVPSQNGGLTMMIDDRSADGLNPDEALGVFAVAVFDGIMKHPHVYLKTAEQQNDWDKRMKELSDANHERDIVALNASGGQMSERELKIAALNAPTVAKESE